MATEVFQTSRRGHLAADITAESVSLTLIEDADFPTDPQTTFRTQINDEIMLLVGGSDPSLTYNVAVINGVLQRGLEGTDKAAHGACDAVVHLLTPGALPGLIQAELPDDESPNGHLFFSWKFLKQLNDMS